MLLWGLHDVTSDILSCLGVNKEQHDGIINNDIRGKYVRELWMLSFTLVCKQMIWKLDNF